MNREPMSIEDMRKLGIGVQEKPKKSKHQRNLYGQAQTSATSGGDIRLDGRLVISGDSALDNFAGGKAVVGVRSELTDVLRGRRQVRPDRNKRLDELVRDPKTGRLVHPSELPIE